MIFLAWHSPDARIRQVAERWRALDDEQQATTELEDICDEVGIEAADLLGDVVRTAYQLEIDLSGVFVGMVRMPE
jgi:hypothetical protein